MSTTFPPEAIDLLLELNTSSVPSCSSMYNATDQNTQIKFYSVILPVIIAFTVSTCVVSGAVVCSAPWVKRPMSPTIRLSLSLAAANTLFSVTWLLCLVVNMYLPTVQGMFSIPICVRLSLEVLRLGSILLQILHLLVVALNHYIGIIRPLHYAAIVTSTTLKAILAVLWLSPLVGMFVAFSSIPGQGFQSFGCRTNYFYECGVTFRLVWTSIFFGPTLVIIIVYCHIFHLLNNRSLYLVSTEQQTQLRKNIKTVRTTALIVGTFVVGWGPAVVKFLLVCSDCVIQELDLHTNMYLGAAFNTLFSLKVFTDTFIYAIRLPDIRKALMTMWMLFRNRLRMRRHGLREGSARSSSRTTSTRLSLSSPSIHRFRSSLSHGSPSSRSGSRSRSASPALQNAQVRRALRDLRVSLQWKGRILGVIPWECVVPTSLTSATNGTTQVLQLPQPCFSNGLQQAGHQPRPCCSPDPSHAHHQFQPCCSAGLEYEEQKKTPTDEPPVSKPEASTSYIIIVNDPSFASDNSTALPDDTCSPHLLEIAVETVD